MRARRFGKVVRRLSGGMATLFAVAAATAAVTAITVVPLWLLATRARSVYTLLVGILVVTASAWAIIGRVRRRRTAGRTRALRPR